MTVSEDVELVGEGYITGPDGQRYKMNIRAEGEITRGPLGRFVDLVAQIEEEGGVVPEKLKAVLIELQQPQE